MHKVENARPEADAQEALTSPKTDAQVLTYIETFVDTLREHGLGGDTAQFKRAAFDEPIEVAGGGVRSIPPRIYREYADEFKELARTSTNEIQRALYLQMQNIWEAAAFRFEAVELVSEREH